jgi:Uma2 family endonuclease
MVSSRIQRITSEQFDVFINQPENARARFELTNGEINEVPSNPYASKIAATILGYIFMYLLENDIGHITGEAGGYRVGDDQYAPDVAFISYATQEHLAQSGYNPNPPDLAVEVISDASNTVEQQQLRLKLSNYLAHAVVVWVVNTDSKTVEVHQAGMPSQVFNMSETLDGGMILPDFTLPIQNIFPKVDDAT